MNTFFLISYALLWLLVIPLVLLNLVLFRQLGIMVMGTARGINQSGLPIGKMIPKVDGLKTDGTPWSTSDLLGQSHILFFGSTTCSECRDIMPYLAQMKEKYNVTPVLMLFSELDMAKKYVKENNISHEVVLANNFISDKLDVTATPFAYAVDENGVIQSKGLINTLQQLESTAQSVLKKVA